PHHVETIHRIFDEKLSGKSLHAIARDLNLENIPTITNKKVDTGWTPTRVRDLLLKESLIGVAYGVSDYFPPAISKEKFHAVQMIRGQGKGKKPTSRQPSSIDIFKGICKCAECGSTLRQRNTKKTPEGRYPRGYLECRNRQLGRCNSKAFNRSLIEDILIQKVFPTLQYLSLKSNGDNISVTTLKADITSLEKGINNLISLAERGLGDLDTLAQRITNNRVELESKKKDLRQAEAIQSLRSDNDIQDSDRKTVEGRIKLQLAIKSFIKEMIFDYYKQEITIRLLNGKSFSGISVARENKDFDHSSVFEVLQKSLLDIDEVHL
ncbi:recombinase family protein, partial [Escherichia coli]|nr:recombinase family protein [Escherichia coli]EEZ2867659.1 recombinase family protein [Escherichia coli]EFA7278279.1 recombinase family protein [Escherichia coli]EFL1189595.1 recombinase family protein [Escherichia coli]EFN3223759.1 recombinase family protein [Escherichia coli]